MIEPGSITAREAIGRGTDPESGAEIVQLTSAPAIHEDIYGETPYMDASSHYLMYITGLRPYPQYPAEVWRADLQTRQVTLVCDEVPGIAGMAVSTDQRHFYCLREYADGPSPTRALQRYMPGEYEIVRTDIVTLEQVTYRPDSLPEVRSLGSLAPDGNTYVFATQLERQLFGIVKCDLAGGEWEVIHEGSDICNAHPQVEPGRGEDICIQQNRGCEFDAEGRLVKGVGEEGATLYIIDVNGGNRRELPVGQPHTWRCQGHQCWIGTGGEILLTVNGGRSGMEGMLKGPSLAEQMKQQGNLLAVRAGDEQARAVANDFLYSHPNASRDGRFFVSDTFYDSAIVVGSIKTGRKRVLCQSRASFGMPQYTHPHPYFSPDCRWVIYNSDCTGVPHVYAARVPEGLLEDLDA